MRVLAGPLRFMAGRSVDNPRAGRATKRGHLRGIYTGCQSARHAAPRLRAMKLAARIVSTLTLALLVAACGGRHEQNSGAATQSRSAASNNKPLTIKGSD